MRVLPAPNTARVQPRLLGFCCRHTSTQREHFVQELCNGGSLRDKVLAQMSAWHKVRCRSLRLISLEVWITLRQERILGQAMIASCSLMMSMRKYNSRLLRFTADKIRILCFPSGC